MIVFASGPRGNGTSLLHRIVNSGDRTQKATFHMPAYPPEFQDWSELLPRSLFVVILRDEWAAAHSLVARELQPTLRVALEEQYAARAFLTEQLRELRDRHFVIGYEGLVADPDDHVAAIDGWLRSKGYTGAPLTHEPIRDENAKWREAAA